MADTPKSRPYKVNDLARELAAGERDARWDEQKQKMSRHIPDPEKTE